MNNEEFLAEMKRRREAAAPPQPPKGQNEYAYIGTEGKQPAISRQVETSETGIIGFLIKKKIAKDAGQANMILIGVFIVVVVVIVWLNWPQSSAPAARVGAPSAGSLPGVPGVPAMPPTIPSTQ